MSDLRQLEPGETIRVINEGAATNATVSRVLDDGFLYIKFFKDGCEHHANRADVFAADEEKRLVARLREIIVSAAASIRKIKSPVKEKSNV